MASIYSGSTHTDVGTAPTGNATVNALLCGSKWGNGGLGVGASVTFSFPTVFSLSLLPLTDGSYSYPGEVGSGQALDATQQQGARDALQQWANVANLTFREVADTPDTGGVENNSNVGTIRFAETDQPADVGASAYNPGSFAWSGDVWLNTDGSTDSPIPGNWAFETYMHEIGHALGLEHPHDSDDGDTMSASYDAMSFSVMSYKNFVGDDGSGSSPSHFPTTPMLYDVLAIQQLYGANYSYNSGNTTYGWTPGAAIYECIWDGGGLDTIDASNQTMPVYLHLTSGMYSTIGAARFDGQASVRDHLVIAFDAWIENAVGTAFPDQLFGNTVSNDLQGGLGNDTICGSESSTDSLDGADTLSGGDGRDSMKGGYGNDWMFGGYGADTLVGDSGDDLIYGDPGDDSLVGDGADAPGGGKDTLKGGTGADTMSGGYGDDLYSVDDAGDVIIEETFNGGIDTVSSTVTYTLSANVENLVFGTTLALTRHGTGNALSNQMSGTAGMNILTGLGGNDTLTGLAGNDTLAGGDGNDSLDGGAGIDTASYASAGGGVRVDLSRTAAQDTGYAAGRDTLLRIENLLGSAHDDVLRGNGLFNVLAAGAGNDQVAGDLGNDSLYGEAGDDTVDGGSGDDLMDGGAGTDTASYANAVAGVVVNLALADAQDTRSAGIDTLVGFENLSGSVADDELTGNGADNLLFGDWGIDVLVGGAGRDTLDGGGSHDTLVGDSGGDTLYIVDHALDKVREAGVVTRVSTTTSGIEAHGFSYTPSITADARTVVFTSSADNLVEGSSGGVSLYAKDLVSGAITQVNADSSGIPGTIWASSNPQISANGRYVVFESWDFNLVANDVNNATDIFVKDLDTGAIALVSTSSTGVQAANDSGAPQITPDGRYVVFASWASNLIAEDQGPKDIFVKDLQTGQVVQANTDSSGAQPLYQSSDAPQITPDGRYVVFESTSAQLVAEDANGQLDVFLKDLQEGDTLRVSTDGSGAEADGASGSAQITPDGRYVAFVSSATNLVADDTNGKADIFLKDLDTGAITRVSTDASGAEGDGDCLTPQISADGRFVVFESAASNLVPGDGNGTGDIFVKDLVTGAIARVSVDAAGNEGNYESSEPRITADGQFIVFTSQADNLVADDSSNLMDVFRVANPLLARSSIDTVQSSVSFTLPATVEHLVLTGIASISATGNALDNILTGNAGNNVLNGADGNDTASYAAAAASVAVSLASTAGQVTGAGTDTLIGVENLIGSSFRDRLAGNPVANVLDGGQGDDVLIGNGGNDSLLGGAGNDELDGGAGVDSLAGGTGNDLYLLPGNDTIVEPLDGGVDSVQSNISHTLGANVENLTLTTSRVSNGTGNGLGNTLTGNIAGNLLRGLGANDRLLGGDGADTLSGGAGIDTLVGGDGADTFRFEAPLNALTNADIVSDFQVVSDTFELENFRVFTALTTTGPLAAAAFASVVGTGGTASVGSARIVYDQDTGNLYYDPSGGDAVDRVLFATLSGSPNLLSNADFIVT